jgi:hypothetical protein
MFGFQNRSNLVAATALLLVVAVSSCSPPPPPKPKSKPKPVAPVVMNPFSAIASGDMEALRTALISEPGLVRTQMQGGVTLLHYACSYPYPNIVEMIVMAGCDIDAITERRMTPVQMALLNKLEPTALFLIKRGANVTIPNDNGRTPLHTAVVSGIGRAAVEAILTRGVDVNPLDSAGVTPLHMAVQTEQGDIAALLVEKGANVEAKTRDGLTPMDLARRNAKGDIMELLSAKLKQIEDTKPKVAVVEPPKPIESPKPIEPPKPTVTKGQVMLVIMNFGGNRIPGQRSVLVRNSGAGPVKGELVWKTIDANDNILDGRLNLTLDGNGQQEVRIGRPIPTVTNYTGGVVSPRGSYTSGYNPYNRPTVTQPTENKFGFLVEFWINGELNNSQCQPPDTKGRIKSIQGN